MTNYLTDFDSQNETPFDSKTETLFEAHILDMMDTQTPIPEDEVRDMIADYSVFEFPPKEDGMQMALCNIGNRLLTVPFYIDDELEIRFNDDCQVGEIVL